MNLNVLSNVSSDDVIDDPYPHVIIRDAISHDDCMQMIESFPPCDVIAFGKDLGSNQRFNYPTINILENPHIDEVWKNFALANTSQQFLNDFIRVFGKSLLKLYPNFETTHHKLSDLRAGIWKRDRCNAPLNAAIDINSSVRDKPSVQRGPHLDQPRKLFFGLLYLRHPEDDSTGGGLQVYRFKDDKSFRFTRGGRQIVTGKQFSWLV